MEFSHTRVPPLADLLRGCVPVASSDTVRLLAKRVHDARDGAGLRGLLRGQGFVLEVASLPACFAGIRRHDGVLVIPPQSTPHAEEMAALCELARHLLAPYAHSSDHVRDLALALDAKIEKSCGKVIDLFR